MYLCKEKTLQAFLCDIFFIRTELIQYSKLYLLTQIIVLSFFPISYVPTPIKIKYIWLINWPASLDVAKLFTSIEFISLQPRFGRSLVPWTWWALQNWTFKVKVCSTFSLKNWSLFLTFVVCFDAMARLGQSSAPEAKLVNKMSTTVQLKLKSSCITNFDFKCPILRFSSCSLDKPTSKTQW